VFPHRSAYIYQHLSLFHFLAWKLAGLKIIT
jgi:hypothetical protein